MTIQNENQVQFNHEGDAGYDLLLAPSEENTLQSVILLQALQAFSQIPVPISYIPSLYLNADRLGDIYSINYPKLLTSLEDFSGHITLKPLQLNTLMLDRFMGWSNHVIVPSKLAFIPLDLPTSFVGLVTPRSGLGCKHQIGLANTIGVIDQGYTGNVTLALENRGRDFHIFTQDARVAQLLFMPILYNPYNLTPLKEIDRGDSKHGSTGL
jgi:deoxyuridine 5'-triphosphate nucleotidohydrolase